MNKQIEASLAKFVLQRYKLNENNLIKMLYEKEHYQSPKDLLTVKLKVKTSRFNW